MTNVAFSFPIRLRSPNSPLAAGRSGTSLGEVAVLNDAHRLAAQHVECIAPLGEQDCSEIHDVPAARVAPADEVVVRQRVEDALPIRRQRLFEQVDVSRIVQQASTSWSVARSTAIPSSKGVWSKIPSRTPQTR